MAVALVALLLAPGARAAENVFDTTDQGLPDVGLAAAAAIAPSGFSQSDRDHAASSGRWPCASRRTGVSSSPRRTASSWSTTTSTTRRPRTYADLSTKVHDIWDRGLLGHRARPAVHDRPAVRVRAVHARRRDRRHGAALGRRLPHAARRERRRLRGQRPALEAERRARSRSSSRTGASSSRATRSARSRSGPTARSTRARATARASTRPTTGRRGPRQPVRRPARRGHLPADGGGRRAAQPGRAHQRRPADARRLDHPREPRHRRGAAGQPERVEQRPEPAPHHRVRPAQPVPLHVPPGDHGHVPRRRGLEHLGGDQPAAQPGGAGRELRLALLRGQRAPDRLRRPQREHLREPLRGRRGSGHGAALHVQPLGEGLDRELPDRRLVRSPARRSTTAAPSRRSTTGRSSSPTTRAAASG